MLACPRCDRRLSRREDPEGESWACGACGGVATTFAYLKRRGNGAALERIVRAVREPLLPRQSPVVGDPGAIVDPRARREGRCACPYCLHAMRKVALDDDDGVALVLDVCTRCSVVWFDRRELESLPKSATPTEHLSPEALQARAAEAYGRLRLQEVRNLEERESIRRMPEGLWKCWAAFLGLPVEIDEPILEHRPWATWALLGAIAFASVRVLARGDGGEHVFDTWGFLPSDTSRHGGLTWITSFFLHAGWWHLIGNLYFLWMFGDNVEDALGKGRFLLLVLASALVGDALHGAFTSNPGIVTVGASGGISGVMAWYAFEYPRVRIGILPFPLLQIASSKPLWLRIPAWFAFVAWFGSESFGVFDPSAAVAHLAHVGGAAAGVLFWLVRRARR